MKNENEDAKINSYENFMKLIENLKEKGGVDLSSAEDLSLAVMNLISLEEHFFFTAMKTGKSEYLDTSRDIREMRKELMATLLPDHEGETWCASKHLLSAAMRLMEVGNKLKTASTQFDQAAPGEGGHDSAHARDTAADSQVMFKKAYQIYSIFWALKLKLVNVKQLKETAKASSQLEDLVAKLADCCTE